MNRARAATVGRVGVVSAGLLLALILGLGMHSLPIPAIALPLALLVPVVLARRSEVAVLLLQDYLPLLTTPITWFVALPELPFSLPFVAMWAVATLRRYLFEGQRLRLNAGIMLNVLFLVLIIASYLAFAERTPYAASKVFLYITLTFASYLAGATFVREQFPRVFNTLIWLGLLVSFLTYQAFLTGTPTMAGRYSAFAMNPIWSARESLFGALFAVIFARRWTWKILGFAFCLPAAVLTGSRGPLLGAIAAVAILAVIHVFTSRRMPRAAATAARGAVVAAVLAVSLAANHGPAIAETRDLGEAGTAQSRALLYQAALQGITEHIWFGVGPGGFEALVNFAEVGEALKYPHNICLEVFVELGVFGFVTFLLMAGYFLWQGGRHVAFAKRHPDDPTAGWGLAATIGYVMLLVASQFSGDLVGNHALWFFMGLISGVQSCRAHPLEPSSLGVTECRESPALS